MSDEHSHTGYAPIIAPIIGPILTFLLGWWKERRQRKQAEGDRKPHTNAPLNGGRRGGVPRQRQKPQRRRRRN